MWTLSSIFVNHTVGQKSGTLGGTQLLEQLKILETKITNVTEYIYSLVGVCLIYYCLSTPRPMYNQDRRICHPTLVPIATIIHVSG